MSARGTAGGTAGEGAHAVATAFVRRLRFLTQPVGGVTGLLMATQPVVQVLNDAGNVDQSYNGNVTLTLQGTGILNGSVTVAAVNGVATWVNLSILGIGVSTLVASASGFAPIASNAINTLAL